MDDLGKELESILEDFAKETEKQVEVILEDNAKKLVKILEQTTPKRTGATARGWTYRKEGNGYRVYNTNYYPIHLIEYGTYRASPEPFVRPAVSKVSSNIDKDLNKI